MSLISCFGVEFIPLSLIFYFFAYLFIILPFVPTSDAGFCHAVKKGKWKFSDWELLLFSFVHKMLLWGLKNTLKFKVLFFYSHMYVFDPPFVTLVISGWSFSSVSCHLCQHSFIFYSGPFLLFNFLNLKQALVWKLRIFFYYCIFDPLGQIQSRNFLLIFVLLLSIRPNPPKCLPLETF